jgi:hypothetical protein
MKKTKHSVQPLVRVTPAVATLPTKSTPVTPAERREHALLRVLKKRFNRAQAMKREQSDGWSITRIARRHRLNEAQVRALLRELSVFGREVAQRLLIHHQKVPGTPVREDKSRGRAKHWTTHYFEGRGVEYRGAAAAATLNDPALRFMAYEAMCFETTLWNRL